MTDPPPDPVSGARAGPRRRWARAALAGCLYLVLALTRSWSLRHAVWAEDGTIHLQDRLDRGTRSVIHAYGGYLHLIPRLIVLAWPQSQFGRWPAYFVASSALVWAAIGTIVFAGTDHMMQTGWSAPRTRTLVAVLAGASVVLCPPGSVESIGNIANLQFPLLGALGVVLASRWSSRRVTLAAGAFTLAVTLSTPLAALLVPPLLLRALADARTSPRAGGLSRRQLVVALGTLGGGEVVQVLTYLVQPSVRQVPESGKGFVEAGRYWASFWAPTWVPTVVVAGFLALLAVIGASGLATRWARWSSGERGAVQLVVSAGCLYLGSYALAGATTPRYLIAPTVLLVAGGCVLAGERRPAPLARPWSVTALVVGVLFVSSTVTHFAPGSYRRSGAIWRDGIVRAKDECGTGGAAASIGVGPTIIGSLDWGVVTVSCDLLAQVHP